MLKSSAPLFDRRRHCRQDDANIQGPRLGDQQTGKSLSPFEIWSRSSLQQQNLPILRRTAEAGQHLSFVAYTGVLRADSLLGTYDRSAKCKQCL